MMASAYISLQAVPYRRASSLDAGRLLVMSVISRMSPGECHSTIHGTVTERMGISIVPDQYR